MSESRHKLTDEQKREFYRDGFLILKKVIPEHKRLCPQDHDAIESPKPLETW